MKIQRISQIGGAVIRGLASIEDRMVMILALEALAIEPESSIPEAA